MNRSLLMCIKEIIHAQVFFSDKLVSEIKSISNQLKDLLKKIFVPDHLRIMLPEIYHHPWIRAEIGDRLIKVNYGKMISFSKYSKVS